MTSQHTGGVKWRQTTVLIRSDIFVSAQEQGIDISSECNRALAGRLGIDYSQQKIPEPMETSPVIIAKEPAVDAAGFKNGGNGIHIHPVLNAEDPSARAHLMKMKKEPVIRQKPAPAHAPAGERAEHSPKRISEPENVPVDREEKQQVARKTAKKASRKKGKDDLIRQFIATQILREDTGDGSLNRIAKDELFPIFVRWCRTNAGKGGTVPDKKAFTIALKNRFAIDESSEEGVQYWNNIRLQ